MPEENSEDEIATTQQTQNNYIKSTIAICQHYIKKTVLKMVRSDPLPRAWHVAAKLVLSEKIVYGKDAKAIYPLQTLPFAISVGQTEIDYCNWIRVLMQKGNVKN